MPVGGVIISTRPEDQAVTLQSLQLFAGLEIHAADEKGNIVAVLDTETMDKMDTMIKEIGGLDTILNVGLTYLHAEDEAERMSSGGYSPKIFGHRRHERESG